MSKQGLFVRRLEPLHLAGGALVVYAAISILWSVGDKRMASAHLLVLSLSFILGVFLHDLRRIWLLLLWASVANLAVALAEWHWWGFAGYGLAGNPNYLGCILAITLAAGIGYRFWWYLPVAIPALLWTQSRGAIFAGGVALMIGLWHRAKATGWIALLIALIVVSQVKTEGGAGSLLNRLGIWQDTMMNLTFFGHGWGSFQEAYTAFPVKTNMTGYIASHAYNDVLELLFELGIGSIFFWTLVLISFEGQHFPGRIICLTFFAAGLTYFPFWILGPVLMLTLGHLSQTKDENQWLVGNYELRTI